MAFEGSLDSVSFADILNTLCRVNKEGVLIVSDDKRKKAIYFRDNGVTLIGGNQRARIGEMLVKAGKIAPKDLETTLSEHKQGTLLGETFIDRGLVTQDEVEEVIAGQIEEEICDIFFWEGAHFSFQEGPPKKELSSEQQVTLTFDVQGVLFKIAAQIGDWEEIRRQIPSFNMIFIPLKEYATLDFMGTKIEKESCETILKHLNGINDVHDIVRLSQLSVLSVCKIIASLLQINAIRPANFDELQKAALECQKKAQIQKQIRFLEQSLELRPNNEQVMLSIAQAYENIGGGKKAGEYYCKLGDRVFISDPKSASKYFERAISHMPKAFVPREKLLSLSEHLDDEEKETYHAKTLARLYKDEQVYDRGIELCSRYIEKYPGELDFRYALVDIYIANKKIEHVVEEYQNLANIYEQSNRIRPYLETLERILEYTPENIEIKKLTIKLHRKLKMEHYRKWIIIGAVLTILFFVFLFYSLYYEFSARNLYYNAKAFENTSYQESKRIYEILLEQYSWSSIVDQAKEDFQKLKEKIDKSDKIVIDLTKDFEKIILQRFEKVKAFAQIGRFAEARQDLEKLKREYPDKNWQKIVEKTDQYIKEEEQKQDIRKTNTLKKEAKLALDMEEYDKALELYKKLLDRIPKNTKDKEELKYLESLNQEIDGIYQTKLNKLLNESNQKFQEGNTKEKEGNFKEAIIFYTESENVVNQAFQIPQLSLEKERELSHIKNLASQGKTRIEEWRINASTKLKEAQILEGQGKIEQAYQIIQELINDAQLSKTESASKALLPIQIITEPPGAVLKDTMLQTPLVVRIQPDEKKTIQLQYPGFSTIGLVLTQKTPPVLEFTLKRASLWMYDTLGPIWGKVAHYRNTVVVTSRSGKIAAINEKNGKILWENRTRKGIGDIEAGASIMGNIVYLGSNDSYLYSMELDTGKKNWEFKTESFIKSIPAVDQESVIVGTMNGIAYSLNKTQGTINWSYKGIDSKFKNDPILFQDMAILVSLNGEVIGLNLLSGAESWKMKLDSSITSETALGSKNIFLGLSPQHLCAIDLEQRKLDWKISLKGMITKVHVSGSNLYVVTSIGYIYCLSRRDGGIVWWKKMPRGIYSEPLEHNGLLYVGCMDSYLYILNAKNGDNFWKGMYGRRGIRSDIVASPNAIYIGTEDGILYALEK